MLRRLAVPAVLGALLFCSIARADDRAMAQELFQQGKDLLAAGKAAEACTKFAAAADLVQTVGVRLNLAACYEKIGRTASAWARYDEALTIAERTGDTAAATFARDARTAVTPRLSYLTITVPAGAMAQGLEITRDAERVPQAAWGVPVPVDPGDHILGAKAPGREAWTTKTSVTGQGTKTAVSIPVLAVSTSVAPTPSVAPGSAAPSTQEGAGLFSGPGATQREIALVAGGLGVVGLGVGSIFGLEMLSKKQSATSAGHCGTVNCGSLSQDAVSAGNVATIGFIAGGALVAGGVTLWLTAPSSKPTATAALVPVAGPRVAGLGVQGSW